MTQKIVINAGFGGFGLSDTAEARYAQLSGKALPVYYWDIARNCPHLVQVVEELGEAANSKYSELKIVEVPRYVKWHIHEYDGMEHVAEDHRTWR
jgi:hypothetical protein